ncbi:MAG: nitroreductase [Spirochaetaceae bacterium]|nr:MAG: nitroreductase [Spirochaetaceae bacterium]
MNTSSKDTSNQIVSVLQSRRSLRALDTREIGADVLERIMTAATLAPSCSNKQPWRYLVARGEDALSRVRLRLSEGNYWARRAPVIVLVITRDDLDCRLDDDRNYAQFDTGMSVMAMLAQAEAEGLYAHPMAGFDSVGLRGDFGIEDGYRLLTVIAIGYPGSIEVLNEKHQAAERSERDRKPLSDVVRYDSW